MFTAEFVMFAGVTIFYSQTHTLHVSKKCAVELFTILKILHFCNIRADELCAVFSLTYNYCNSMRE